MKRIIVLSFIIVVVFTLIVAMTIRQDAHYWCDECYSSATSVHWSFGLFPDYLLEVTPVHYAVQPSAIHVDFFAPEHSHTWRLASANDFFFGGLATISSTRGDYWANDLAQLYNESPAFRMWLKARIETGLLSQEQIYRFLAADDMSADLSSSHQSKSAYVLGATELLRAWINRAPE